ncbi:6928_t:CDS:2 [Scutellospora calospora]|uniref:6928_t:CDS:1 n=1 Tax=Scutellospora calospora TaxID=85575 RepID=A0ACA9JTV2_9GLOM|nr:6928_t:CDS:2 [Scutellospora calospora]
MLITTLQIGMKFPDMESVHSALENYSVETSLPYKFRTNNSNKLLVVCLLYEVDEASTCSFIVSAHKCKDGYIHIIRLIQHDQNCSTFSETFKVRESYLTKFTALLVEDITAFKPCDIVNHLCTEVGAEASYMKAWRSQAINKKHSAEEIEKSYQHINSLLNNLLIENSESVTTFKSSYKDVYFSVSMINSKNRLVPIAFAICSVKNSNNWTWFCEHLHMTFPFMNMIKTIIISDRKKHIEKNVNTKFKTKLGGKIWAVAKALHVEEFNKIIEEISDLHEEASIYLSKIPSAKWTLSKYS